MPVIIKGCSNKPVPENAYMLLIAKLQPVVKSLMYGEACSSVPLYKKPNNNYEENFTLFYSFLYLN
jgi:hypothetical protein